MPELGKYTLSILGAYGTTIAIILLIIFISLHKARRAKNILKKIHEKRTETID